MLHKFDSVIKLSFAVSVRFGKAGEDLDGSAADFRIVRGTVFKSLWCEVGCGAFRWLARRLGH